jgi:hypothetical protein
MCILKDVSRMTRPNQSPEPTAVSSRHSFRAEADGGFSSAFPPTFHFGATSAVHATWFRVPEFWMFLKMGLV